MEETNDLPSSDNLAASIQSKKDEINEIGEKISTGAYSKLTWRERRQAGPDQMQENLRRATNNLQKLEKNKTRRNKLNRESLGRRNILSRGVSLDYIIVKEIEGTSFTNAVMKKIAEGYVLQGGVSYNPANLARQALVKNLS